MLTVRGTMDYMHSFFNSSGLVTNETLTDECFDTLNDDFVTGIEIIGKHRGYYIFPALYAFYGIMWSTYDIAISCPAMGHNIWNNLVTNVFVSLYDLFRVFQNLIYNFNYLYTAYLDLVYFMITDSNMWDGSDVWTAGANTGLLVYYSLIYNGERQRVDPVDNL